MEIKTKYQYTYFLYPYVVKEKDYEKHLEKLLHNKSCELKIFETEKDSSLYRYFLPKVRDYMFWSFGFSKNKINKLKEFDNKMQSKLLSKYPCTIFEYNIEKDIQGKTNKKDGIFFAIRGIELICFNTGICFLKIKTTLDEDCTLADICNFNYKFRDINSSTSKLKDFENIKIQTDAFKEITDVNTLIKDLAGNRAQSKEINLDTERFITYSYACIGQEQWGEDNQKELIDKEFYKYASIEPEDYVVDFNNVNKFYKTEESKHIKYACTNMGTVLLTSDVNTDNYTKIPHKFENEYLYNYIYELYKKIYLKKLNKEFSINNKFAKSREDFINFTNKIWIEEETNDELGCKFQEQWKTNLKLNTLYSKIKQKYDVMYKNINIEKTAKSNKWIAIILIILVLINLVNCIHIFK